MRDSRRFTRMAMEAGVVALGASARAEVTGSFDGSVASKKLAQPIAAAAVFSEVGGTVSGTMALPGDLAGVGGAHLVVGTATSKRIKVSGNGPGGAIKWRAKIVGDTLTGKAK